MNENCSESFSKSSVEWAVADSEEKSDVAPDSLQFLESARKGDPIPPEVIIKFSKYFKDEFTL